MSKKNSDKPGLYEYQNKDNFMLIQNQIGSMHLTSLVQKIFIKMCSKFQKLGAENFTELIDVRKSVEESGYLASALLYLILVWSVP